MKQHGESKADNCVSPKCFGNAAPPRIMSKSSKQTYLLLVIIFLTSLMPVAVRAQLQGVLEVQIKDHRDAIGDFAKLDIVIDKILVSPKVGVRIWRTAWQELVPSQSTVDLTKHVGKPSARVLRSSVEAGRFDAFHLRLKHVGGVLKKNQKPAPVKDTLGPVKLAFEVPPKGETILVIDLTVVDLSDHPPRGYELGIKGYELYTNGKLIDKVPPG